MSYRYQRKKDLYFIVKYNEIGKLVMLLIQNSQTCIKFNNYITGKTHVENNSKITSEILEYVIRRQSLHNFSDTPSDICEFKHGIEDTYHYLFGCLLFTPQRIILAVTDIGTTST